MKVALVTGASKGIGYATARSLAENGVAVAIHYNSGHESATELMQQINSGGGRAIIVPGDLAKKDTPKQIVNLVAKDLGGIDILVNNAGVFTEAAISELTDDLWDETIAINLTSVFKLTRACVPHMIKNNWGRIINISSQAAKSGSKNHSHYVASKAGLIGFNNSIAKELGKHAVTVNVVLPGRIVTEMIEQFSIGRIEEWLEQTPLRRLGTAQEVANLVAFLASAQASYITGACLNVTGGVI